MTTVASLDGNSIDAARVTEHCVSIQCNEPAGAKPFSWTAQKIIYCTSLFFLAGLAEIGGGWLIFQTIRVGQPFWWGILGSAILVIYGFIPTLQPISNFGRVFAVYGGYMASSETCKHPHDCFHVGSPHLTTHATGSSSS